jgi:hypothetical protein
MTRKCEMCGKTFEAERARYCGSTCRANKTRGAQPVGNAPTPAVPKRSVSGLLDAVNAELEMLDKLNTVIGQHALELANRIVSAPGMNAGVGALSKELSRVMGDARSTSTVAVDPVDELKARRDAKLAG